MKYVCIPLFTMDATLDREAPVVEEEDDGLQTMSNHHRNFLNSQLPIEGSIRAGLLQEDTTYRLPSPMSRMVLPRFTSFAANAAPSVLPTRCHSC